MCASESSGSDPCWKVALEELKEAPLKARAKRIPGAGGGWAFWCELKGDAGLPTIHRLVALELAPESLTQVEKRSWFPNDKLGLMSEGLSEI